MPAGPWITAGLTKDARNGRNVVALDQALAGVCRQNLGTALELGFGSGRVSAHLRAEYEMQHHALVLQKIVDWTRVPALTTA